MSNDEQQFLTLEEYLTIAKRMIMKFAPKFYSSLAQKMLKDDDAISQVAYAIMRADETWNPDYRSKKGTVKSKYSYRNQYGIWAIQKYIFEQKKVSQQNVMSLSYHSDKCDNEVALSGIIMDTHAADPVDIISNREESKKQTNLVNQLLSSGILTTVQEKYIRAYYLEDKTLQEVSKIYGVSRQAVSDGIQHGIMAIRNLI